MSGDQLVRGADAIQKRYCGVFAGRPTIELRTLTVSRAEGLVMLTGTWVVHQNGDDGRQVRREGRNVETARQQSDGRWLFVIDSSDLDVDESRIVQPTEMSLLVWSVNIDVAATLMTLHARTNQAIGPAE